MISLTCVVLDLKITRAAATGQGVFSGAGVGAEWKESMTKPGEWFAYFEAYGETLPDHNNTVRLSEDKKDKWGLPLLKISMEYGENEKKMRVDMQQTAVEMLKLPTSTGSSHSTAIQRPEP